MLSSRQEILHNIGLVITQNRPAFQLDHPYRHLTDEDLLDLNIDNHLLHVTSKYELVTISLEYIRRHLLRMNRERLAGVQQQPRYRRQEIQRQLWYTFIEDRRNSCVGCINEQPNQLAHACVLSNPEDIITPIFHDHLKTYLEEVMPHADLVGLSRDHVLRNVSREGRRRARLHLRAPQRDQTQLQLTRPDPVDVAFTTREVGSGVATQTNTWEADVDDDDELLLSNNPRIHFSPIAPLRNEAVIIDLTGDDGFS